MRKVVSRQGLYRRLDGLRLERFRAHRMVSKHATKIEVVKKLRKVPGLGPRTAPALVAWIADPNRFRNESGLSSHAGLGLKNDFSNWKPTKRARASKRGNLVLSVRVQCRHPFAPVRPCMICFAEAPPNQVNGA